MDKYILDADGQPVKADLMTWAKWFKTAERHVAKDSIGQPEGTDIDISTVFLGLDHRFSNTGEPVLWETMIFGGPHDGYQDRYTSRADADAGHAKAVRIVKGKESAS